MNKGQRYQVCSVAPAADALLRNRHPILAKRVIRYWAESEGSWVGAMHPDDMTQKREEIEAICKHYKVKLED